MATLKSKKLQEALKKVRNVGRAEETVTIDGCAFVLQSLAGSDYDAALKEVSELDGSEYFHAYQIEHVCRSIVEIEGYSLREADFVEEDVPSGDYVLNAAISSIVKAQKAQQVLKKELGIDLTIVPPEGDSERTVTLERHAWVRKQIAGWSQEAIGVAYRKFADVVALGEERAKDKVEFRVPNESDEDKFRRLLGEAKAIEAELPMDLVKKALEDIGYLHASTPEEREEAARRVSEFAAEQQAQRVAAEQPKPEPDPDPEPPTPVAKALPAEIRQEAAELMRNRTPLNQVGISPPVPAVEAQQVAAPVLRSPAPVPPQIQQALQKRPAQSQTLEGLDPGVDVTRPVQMHEPVELTHRQHGVEPKGVLGLIDRPPTAGLNPKFRKTT